MSITRVVIQSQTECGRVVHGSYMPIIGAESWEMQSVFEAASNGEGKVEACSQRVADTKHS